MATTTYADFTASVRAISARTDNAGTAVVDYTAEEDRLMQALLTEGYVTANAFKVNATTGMTLTVGSGSAKTDLYAVAGDNAGQGVYLARLDAAPVSLTVPAADPAQTRVDEVYLVIADRAYDAGTLSLPRIGYRKGVAGSGAPGPDTAWRASVKLATVTVAATATTITAGNVTDNRTVSTIPLVLTGAVDPRYLGAGAKAADSEQLDGIDSGAFQRVLGSAYYEPGTAVAKSTISTSFTAADTTNLRATFVAPASGAVTVRFGGYCSAATGAACILGLLDGATPVAVANAGIHTGYRIGQRRITGLTPGTTYSYDLAHASNNSAAASVLLVYGGGLSSDGFGAGFVEVLGG